MKIFLSIIGTRPCRQFDIHCASDGDTNSTLVAGRVVAGEKELLVA